MDRNSSDRDLNTRPFYMDRFEVSNNREGIGGRERATGQRPDEQVRPGARERKPSQGRAQAKVKAPLGGWLNMGTPDVMFIFIVLILLLIGLVMMFSASYTYAYYDYKTGHDALYYIKRQGVFAALGVVMMFTGTPSRLSACSNRRTCWRERNAAMPKPSCIKSLPNWHGGFKA